MGSQLKLKNANGVTTTIANEDTNTSSIVLNTGELASKSTPVADRIALLARTGIVEGEAVWQTDIGLMYTWTNTQGVDNGGTIINVGTGSWVASYSGAVNVKWFGAKGDGVADDTVSIQKAVYNIGDVGTIIKSLFLPAGQYKITKPILFYGLDGLRIYGESKLATQIKPSGLMSPDFSNDVNFQKIQADGVHQYADKNCCFLIAASRRTGDDNWTTVSDNTAEWYMQFEHMAFIGEYGSDVMGIYSPRLAQSTFRSLFFKSLLHGISFADTYRNILDHCDFVKTKDYPIGHNDNGIVATGTSTTLINCMARACFGGFKFNKLFYSSLINCAVDNWATGVVEDGTIQTYAYSFNNCNITLESCGCEDVQPTLTKGMFNITGDSMSSTIISGGNFIQNDTAAVVHTCQLIGGELKISNAIIELNSANTKTPRWVVTSGKVNCADLNQSTYMDGIFLFSGPNPAFYGNDESLYIRATDKTSVAVGDNFGGVVDFGTLDNAYFDYGTYDAGTFTALFSGTYEINVKYTVDGPGMNYTTPRLNGAFVEGTNLLDPTDVRQAYNWSAALYMEKGDTFVQYIRTSSGATVTYENRNLSIKQIN
ncbi:MAG: glycosyl hydrolase family 28-related protein [Nanoarchaeota archaeon]|nr:glycosyl hydrolase family 28-related protein [Nanoarchaeota archaeon]